VEERRKHPQECLKAEEWREIHDFVATTKEHRTAVMDNFDQIRKEAKERFEIMLAELRSRDISTNDRVTKAKDMAGKIISWGVCAIVTFAVAWGGLTSVVVTNTKKWAELEPEHQKLMTDVEVLKEKSYGYRGVKVVESGKSV
jgi:hypothetical protein